MLHNSWLIEKLDLVDSTQSYLKKHYTTGQRVVIAKDQKAGYGQKDRQWESYQGNLQVTLAFPCQEFHKNQITIIAIVALGKSLSHIKKDLPYQYKWVNDLLLEGQKVAGILTESQGHDVFLGLGVNLIKNPANNISSNLRDHGLEVSPEELLSLFLETFTVEFNSWINNGFKAAASDWKERACGLGEEVTLALDSGKKITGLLVDLNEAGLIIEKEGEKIALLSGTFLGKSSDII
jgi:BirA family biotin operon repressor/biotin-[acetyl-CoA-carboxylase] ligase